MSGQFSAGISANVALASLPASRWHHCKHHAVVIFGVLLALMPTLHWHLCPCCAGIATFVVPILPPASQTGICPTTTQLQHICVRGVIVVVIFLTHGLVAVPGVVPRQLGLQWSGQCSIGVFASVVLASLPTLCCSHCQHCAVVIADIAPASLPLSCGRICHCCAGIVALVTPALLPALQTGLCPVSKQSQHALASLPVYTGLRF